MPAAPGGRKGAPVQPEPRNRRGVRLVIGYLVVRADELASRSRMLGELERGCTGAIEVACELGIGTTRLLREVAARAGAGGYLVLSGSAAEFERDLPFAVFV